MRVQVMLCSLNSCLWAQMSGFHLTWFWLCLLFQDTAATNQERKTGFLKADLKVSQQGYLPSPKYITWAKERKKENSLLQFDIQRHKPFPACHFSAIFHCLNPRWYIYMFISWQRTIGPNRAVRDLPLIHASQRKPIILQNLINK